ncbi:unnamed protein product [Caretta caretta]
MVYFSHLTVRTAGVIILFSPDLQPKVLVVSEAVLGQLLHLQVHMEGIMVNLINVYAPTSGPERLHPPSSAPWILASACVDYKVVAKAISLWLGSVLVDVVLQTYTILGRTMFDNLYLVQDLLELGCRDGLSFALLSVDQEKAFDRVDHRINWTLTEPISLGRGIWQACPLSGQLYALAIKPFLGILHRRLTGLVLRELELQLVLSAYADDVLLVVQDPGDLAWVEACQAIYSAASSPRVNWVKSSSLMAL